MPLWGMLVSALAEIRHSKVRAALSVICVAIGVAAVTMVTLVASSSSQMAQQEFERFAGRPGTITIMPPESENGPPSLDRETVNRMRATMREYGVLHTPVREWGAAVYRRGDHTIQGDMQVITRGVDPDYDRIRRIRVAHGRWLTEGDLRRLEPSLVVSRGFAARLGLPGASAIGETVDIAADRWIRARIVGVLDIGEEGAERGRPPEVYLPFDVMVDLGMAEDYSQFQVRVPESDADALIERVKAASTSAWGMPKAATVDRMQNDFGRIGSTLNMLLLGAALAVIVLGSLPVLALGLSAIKHRRAELGVQRCFGATGPDLFLTVLLESLIVSAVGGLVGIGVAWIAHEPVIGLLGRMVGEVANLSFPLRAALLGLGVALCVGVVSGLLPAMRAMQRSVIRAIRS
ncbi:ABC transporter permease [Bailinhaonella thermotolerans]|uniref:ABC transporter permease n=1 Tax=Bailinhaonella thermotolerans TaxID=1070861 RepID=A0A3A4A9U1_9ACTN|nr:ABC transporter permease [Bailinhaonella thermotolerans]RJL22096.1 ABC transporter permease [Bailinhaonella thermotolerans]